MFPNCATPEPYDFGTANNQEWSVDDLMGHCQGIKGLEFEVQQSLGNTTWESLEMCKDLEALDQYLEIQGVKCPGQFAQ